MKPRRTVSIAVFGYIRAWGRLTVANTSWNDFGWHETPGYVNEDPEFEGRDRII